MINIIDIVFENLYTFVFSQELLNMASNLHFLPIFTFGPFATLFLDFGVWTHFLLLCHLLVVALLVMSVWIDNFGFDSLIVNQVQRFLERFQFLVVFWVHPLLVNRSDFDLLQNFSTSVLLASFSTESSRLARRCLRLTLIIRMVFVVKEIDNGIRHSLMSIDHILKLQILLHIRFTWLKHPFHDHLIVCFINSFQNEFLDCYASFEGHEAQFSPNLQYFVLSVYLFVDIFLILLDDSILIGVIQNDLARLSFQIFNTFLIDLLDQLDGRSLDAIECLEAVDQKLQEDCHLLLVFDDEVDITPLEFERYTGPRVERKVLKLVSADRINLLSQDPETGRRATENKGLNLRYFARAARFR